MPQEIVGLLWVHKKLVFLRICVRMEKNKGKAQEFQCRVSMGKMPVFKRRRLLTPGCGDLLSLGQPRCGIKKEKCWEGLDGDLGCGNSGLCTNKQTNPAINISWWATRSREASSCCLQKSGEITPIASSSWGNCGHGIAVDFSLTFCVVFRIVTVLQFFCCASPVALLLSFQWWFNFTQGTVCNLGCCSDWECSTCNHVCRHSGATLSCK